MIKDYNNELGGFNIKNNRLLSKCDDNTKYWIFNINKQYLNKVLSENTLAAIKKRSINIDKISPNDIIIISSKLDNKYSIIGITMADEIYVNDEKLFGYFESNKKIKLKSIKYFNNPLIFIDIKEKLSIKTLSKKEMFKINRKDFEEIINTDNLISEKPSYLLDDFKIKHDEFILNIIKVTYETLNRDNQLKQMNILEFVKIVYNNLKVFKLKIQIDEVKSFYSRNIWKLKYHHVPSRDPDKNMLLYNSMGKSKNYGYIIFNH